jgi:methyl-accepting chemotaxis protein
MSISGKIKVGLGILLAFLAAQFGVGQFLDYATQSKVDAAITKNFAAADSLAELGTVAQQIRRYEKEFFIYVNDEAGRKKYRKEWTDAYEKFSATLAKMSTNADGAFSAKDSTSFGGWTKAAQFYGDEFKSIMVKADAGTIVPPPPPVVEEPAKPAKGAAAPVAVVAPAPDLSKATKLANDMIGPGKDRFKEVLDGTQALRKEKIAASAQSVTEIRSLFTTASLVTLGVFLVGLAVAIYLMITLPRAVRKPIEEFVGITDKMSKGDLKQVIHAEGAAEFEGLSKSLERLRIAQSGLLDKLRAKATSPFQA